MTDDACNSSSADCPKRTLLFTRMHIGVMGTVNAEQLSATSDKTRDALVKRHALGRNPGGVAYGYEKRIEHDGNGERIKGLQQIVPTQAATIVRICEDFVAGVAPGKIVRRLNEEGVPPPRSGKRDKKLSKKPSAWSPNTITGNAERGTGILNNILYTGRRPYLTQTYRKNPDTGKRHGFLVAADQRAGLVESPELRIVSDELWDAVKARQASLARGPRADKLDGAALPFFAQQRPKYLLTGKMTCGECGASYAKSGKTRFGCQGSAQKGTSYCGNRLTIRQDELDARVLAGLTTEMLRDDVLAVFLEEYAAETARLTSVNEAVQPARDAELEEVLRQLDTMKAAIIKGLDPLLFVGEMNQLGKRRDQLESEAVMAAPTAAPLEHILTPDLSRIYREKVAKRADAFEDDALRSQAFERIRGLIDAVKLTPEDGELVIHLRGELEAMLKLCAGDEQQKAPADVSVGALQIKMVAGTGFEAVTFRL
ncbi:recombinase family protein [Sphingomonas sp. Tas61C01]|uniref:recombinase family protein n=1 Tax=Sphingomonas sp. Tas61C01 TaxID=3458297 RepID=UPI00403EDAE7